MSEKNTASAEACGSASRNTRKWCCSYSHDGSNWTVIIDAYDRSDAEARVSKLGYLRLDGELMGTVPFGWLARTICWIRNALDEPAKTPKQADAQTETDPQVRCDDGLASNDAIKRFMKDVEPLLMEWCIKNPHWRRSESDPWQDPYGGHDLLRRARGFEQQQPWGTPDELEQACLTLCVGDFWCDADQHVWRIYNILVQRKLMTCNRHGKMVEVSPNAKAEPLPPDSEHGH